MFQLQTSNPALKNNDAFSQYYGKNMFASRSAEAAPNVTTMQGVINKTSILIGIAVLAGAGGYALLPNMPSVLWISSIAAFVVCLGFGFLLGGKPALSPIVAPVYAVVEGVFLGALTRALDEMLAGMGYNVAGGLALQAFVITISVMLGMLGLYYAKILRPTKMFVAVVSTAAAGIFFIYLISFVLMLFGGPQLPFITLGSAMQGGTAAMIGLGVNVLILGLASLFLIIDFKQVEDNIAAGAPKYMEWYCGYALLVTLAWIYLEAVKLVFRLAVMFGDRD